MARHEITFKRVVYEIDGMRAVPVRRDIEYADTDAGPLMLDLYLPPASGSRPPVVVIVSGFPDVGVPLPLGCTSTEMEMTISWAQLIAASGMAAVSYTKQDPARDTRSVLDHLAANEDALGIDARRIGIWAASGNVPVALSLLLRESTTAIACAVLCYGFTLDAGEGTVMADAAATWRFANATAGRAVADLKTDVPLFIVRAGGDTFPGLNESLDRFVGDALARDVPLTLVNASGAPHAFDLFDPGDSSRHIVRLMLSFLQYELRRAR
jgi:hypothetical protein